MDPIGHNLLPMAVTWLHFDNLPAPSDWTCDSDEWWPLFHDGTCPNWSFSSWKSCIFSMIFINPTGNSCQKNDFAASIQPQFLSRILLSWQSLNHQGYICMPSILLSCCTYIICIICLKMKGYIHFLIISPFLYISIRMWNWPAGLGGRTCARACYFLAWC